MIEYFRSRGQGVLRESPELQDPSNVDVMVATMNGLTDEAWAVGCFFEKSLTNRTVENYLLLFPLSFVTRFIIV